MLIYICEDAETDRMRLLHYLERYRRTLENKFFIDHLDIEVFDNGSDLIAAWNSSEEKPDLLFLDIYMEGKDGMETARILRDAGCTAGIIFTTSSRDHAMDSYDVEALYYLQKPYTYDRFLAAMSKCEDIFRTRAACFRGSIRGRDALIPFADILCLESSGHYVIVHAKNQADRQFRMSMNQALEQARLNPAFIPCGKSFIVNLNEVMEMSDKLLTLSDRSTVPVPYRVEKEVKTALESWQSGHHRDAV